MKKSNKKITSIILTLIIIVTAILSIPFAASASSPDDLIGRWERFGDGAEGTVVTVTKVGNVYQARLDKVTGTLITLAFAVGDNKWKDVTWKSDTTYNGKDMFRFEAGGYEYRNSIMNIDNTGILKVYVANTSTDVAVIIGTYQTWRKLSSTSTKQIVLQIDNPKMTVNGVQKEIDPGMGTSPLIVSSRTILPIRAIIEELGGTIAWNATERKVTIQLGAKNIELWIGSTTTRINGVTKMTDVAPQIIKSRTMVPLRYIIDNLGYGVAWDGTTRKVTITY